MKPQRLATLIILLILAVSVSIYSFYHFKYQDVYQQTSQLVKVIAYFAFVFLLTVNFALLEINIEGAEGWARKLPTWVLDSEKVLEKVLRVFGGRPMTGYHVLILFYILPFLLHFPVFFTPWSLQKEFVVIGTYFLLLVLEDFLWFVLNPAFGLKNFNKEKIWWHKNWLWRVPDTYIGGILLSIVFLSYGLPGL